MNSRPWIIALVVGGLALAGCVEKRKPADAPSKKPPAKTAPAKPAAPKPEAPKAEPAAAPAGEASLGGYLKNLSNAEKTAAATADLSLLTKAVQQFGATEGRLPTSLDELVTMKYLQAIPAPPRGQQLRYDPATGLVHVEPRP